MGYINSKLFPNFVVGDFSPVCVMGVVNLSPESFFKDSYVEKNSLTKKCNAFISNGAKILDLGARSTAPWSKKISLAEECERIELALDSLPKIIPSDVAVSIDTQYSKVAELALERAQEKDLRILINDVSSFTTDKKLLDVVTDFDCPCVIMATEEKIGDAKSIREILGSLQKTLDQLRNKQYDLSKVVIDPGMGKWVKEKTYEYDLSMLDNLEDFRVFGLPILVGLSRKSFIGTVLNEKEPAKREIGSLAATSIAVYNGAHIIRTHDVNENMMQTIKMASAIRRKPVIIAPKAEEDVQSCEYLNPVNFTRSAYHLLKQQYKVTPAGSRIMKNKMVLRYIVLRNLTAPQALILKQEMLARGGECAIDKQVITTEGCKYDEIHDVVLIGTIKQLESLVGKLKGQQLKLDLIASLIEKSLSKAEDTQSIYRKDPITYEENRSKK